MKAKLRRNLALSLFSLCVLTGALTANVQATSVVVPTDDELVIGARAIVRAGCR